MGRIGPIVAANPSVLGLDAELLSTCVSCGLCLPHCPTFRVTGEEKYSPRGRIDAMRVVDSATLPIDDSFVDFVETCVQCRGCEPACPSGVHFGALMEQTRTALASSGAITPWWQRGGLRVLGHHRTLLLGSSLLAAAQRLRLVPRRLGLPGLPIRRVPRVESTGNDVWLFTGCVMDSVAARDAPEHRRPHHAGGEHHRRRRVDRRLLRRSPRARRAARRCRRTRRARDVVDAR